MSALLAVTPNPALDRTWLVDGSSRPRRTLVRAGGKGVNVARAWVALGGDACAAGIAAGCSGRLLRRALAEDGIADGFVVGARGETRTCAVIVEATGGGREIYEPGAPVEAADVARLETRVRRLLASRRFAWLACGGSLAPGMPVDLPARLVAAARAAGVRAAIDATGEPLLAALAERPDVVKANADELGALVGGTICDVHDARSACAVLLARAVAVAVATLGGDGAVGVDGRGAWHVGAPRVPLVSAVGSGDCFLAGFLAALDDGLPAALRLAAAAGADNARRLGAGAIDRRATLRLAPRARVRALVARAARRTVVLEHRGDAEGPRRAAEACRGRMLALATGHLRGPPRPLRASAVLESHGVRSRAASRRRSSRA